jgi:hypothetical protein
LTQPGHQRRVERHIGKVCVKRAGYPHKVAVSRQALVDPSWLLVSSEAILGSTTGMVMQATKHGLGSNFHGC